jgi:hypothetical protein
MLRASPSLPRRQLLAIGLLGVLAIGSGACKKPLPPKVTPKEARVTAISSRGLDVLLKVEATNPNAMTLSARSVTGKAKLDGRYDLGTVTIEKPVVLPPNNVPTMIDVPMTLPWSDLTTLGIVASATRPLPYTIEGTVAIGGERFNVDVPFRIDGTITREQIAGAALKSLPPLPTTLPALKPQ